MMVSLILKVLLLLMSAVKAVKPLVCTIMTAPVMLQILSGPESAVKATRQQVF